MATSPNFSWPEPDNTDLVKNGALAIRTAVDAIDASMAELKGGTTGQVLSKTSNTDMDFTWVAQDDSNAIQNAIVDAKGDIITATAADTPARIGVGANGTVLTADSSEATGLKWATPASGMTNPMTTTGDTIYSSSGSTPARLGIGSTGQVLTVAGGVPSWATPSAGGGSGLTLVSSTTISGATSSSFNNVFTSTYANYRIIVSPLNTGGSGTSDISFRYRASGTDTSANYNTQRLYAVGTTIGGLLNTLGTDEVFFGGVNPSSSNFVATTMEMYGPQAATETRHHVNSTQYDGSGIGLNILYGYNSATTQFDGFTLISNNGNISATVRIYGYQNS